MGGLFCVAYFLCRVLVARVVVVSLVAVRILDPACGTGKMFDAYGCT